MKTKFVQLKLDNTHESIFELNGYFPVKEKTRIKIKEKNYESWGYWLDCDGRELNNMVVLKDDLK
jgi:hypothetical protein